MALNRRHILFVDDDPLARTLVESMLTQAGHIVVTATDAFSAIDLIDVFAFDGAIFDIMMPKMNGVDLLKRIRSRAGTKSMPVVMLTARDDQRMIKRAIETGANGYLIKPPQRETLIAKIDSVLRTRPAFREFSIESSGPLANAQLHAPVKVLAVGETGVVVRSSTPVEVGSSHKLEGGLLDALGIPPSTLKVVGVRQDGAEQLIELGYYHLKPETVVKIRNWVLGKTSSQGTAA